MVRVAPLVAIVALVGVAGCKSLTGGLSPNTGPTRDTHTRYFPITAQTAHGTVDCDTCHGAFASFTQFDCLSSGCHPQATTDAGHSNVPGYGYDSPGCYRCHPTGVGVDHSKIFAIGPGTRHNLACATCHIDSTTRLVFSCTTSPCHPQSDTNPRHDPQNVPAYQYTPTSCFNCHKH